MLPRSEDGSRGSRHQPRAPGSAATTLGILQICLWAKLGGYGYTLLNPLNFDIGPISRSPTLAAGKIGGLVKCHRNPLINAAPASW